MLNAFRRNPQGPTIEALYGAIVAQARSPALYLDYQVPDSVNGRLDMLILHLALAFGRLSREGERGAALGQGLFDRFCRDMDDHLREQGVGDLKVPKEMRRLGAAFFGRHGTYLNALKEGDPAALRAGLARNVYQDIPEAEAAAERLAGYVMAAHAALAAQDPATILRGRLDWPDPAA